MEFPERFKVSDFWMLIKLYLPPKLFYILIGLKLTKIHLISHLRLLNFHLNKSMKKFSPLQFLMQSKIQQYLKTNLMDLLLNMMFQMKMGMLKIAASIFP